MKTLPSIATAFAALAIAMPGFSQSLQVTMMVGTTTTNVSSGGSATVTAIDIGQPVTASITVRNTGTVNASITGISLLGSAELTLVLAPGFPVSLSPNATTSFSVQYLPSTGNAVSAQVSISFVANTLPAVFAFSVTGKSPRLAYSYYFPPNGASTDLNSGDRISFPTTNIGNSANAVVNVFNRGSATATIQTVTVTGAGFQLGGSPGPFQLPAGTQTSFAIAFSPLATSGNQGLLVLALASGNVSFFLTGTGASSNLTLTYALADGNVHPLGNGSVIPLPTIDVNSTSTANISILNQGAGSGSVSSISLSGAGFRLSGVPLLPATIAPGQALQFGIVFAPTQTGTFSASFGIDMSGRSVSGTVTGSTTTSNFSVTYTLADGVVTALPGGATISFPAVDINATTTANIEVANQGTGAGAISAIAVAGTGFRLSGTPALPANVAAGQSVRFGIVFVPTQAGSYSGTFRIDLPGRSLSGSLAASTATSNISFTYIDPDTNNILPLSDGGTLSFPKTATGAFSTVTLVASNSGAGTGTIDSVTVNTSSPAAFQLLNLPALPASVAPARQLRFGVRFSPQQQQAFSGTLLVSVNGHPIAVNLQGQGSSPQFMYTYGTDATPAVAGGTIAFADTAVGQTTTVKVSITNNGSADGQISAIAVTGAGYSLSDLPVVPVALPAGGSQSFTLSFTPSQPGAATGRLTVGADSFTLSGNGIGSRLTYSYTNTAAAVPVLEGGIVIFPPLEVGKNEKLQFTIQNTGTSAATVSTINLVTPGTSFALEQLPALPFSLAAGDAATFGLSFTPGTTGSLTTAMRVNTASFSLSGNGIQPTALPVYQFQAPAGTVLPAQQPAIGMALASSYQVEIAGTLKLTFASSVFTDDAAIQFATGGRSVNFTIAANSTQAMFNGSPSIALQTGTTAGTIVITPSFTMRNGFDLTPTTPDTLTMPVLRVAPQILSASIGSLTPASFTLVLNGYSTTRAMRQLDIQFTPKQGETFSATHLTLDVTAASAAWYQSAASQGTGGSFLAAIPFVLANGSSSTDDLVHRLQSVSITATNEAGVSTAVTVPIQ